MTAKTKALTIEAAQYIHDYNNSHNIPHDELSDWLLGERFVKNWRKEYIDNGDEFLKVWLDSYYKRGRE